MTRLMAYMAVFAVTIIVLGVLMYLDYRTYGSVAPKDSTLWPRTKE